VHGGRGHIAQKIKGVTFSSNFIKEVVTMSLEAGIKGTQEVIVSAANTAKTMGSGTLDVFATPAMIALMEKTAWESVQPQLDEGSGTVGTSLQVKHVAATPVGMKVTCESELIRVDGRALTFSVKAYDETGLIGEGEHERFIVFNDKFQAKADAKRNG
jgi:predicted thioesterase